MKHEIVLKIGRHAAKYACDECLSENGCVDVLNVLRIVVRCHYRLETGSAAHATVQSIENAFYHELRRLRGD